MQDHNNMVRNSFNPKAFRGLMLVCSATLLIGCNSASIDSQPGDEPIGSLESAEDIHARIRAESSRLLAMQERIRSELANETPREEPVAEVVAEIDPLDDVLVTIDVHNEDVQNVLRALSEQAGMNLLLDPELANLNRRISMSLRQVPASLVLDRVMQLLDLNGEVQRNVLVVRPFEEVVFNLDFLQDVTSMDFNMGGDVFGANSTMSGASGGGGSGGGESAMTGNIALTGINAEGMDPYQQLDEMLQGIIGRRERGGREGPTLPGISQFPATSSTSIDELERESLAANPVYSLNRMTGTLFIRARPSQVSVVRKLIDQYRDVLQRQVLIEAQILDVSLSDQFEFGIDWGLLRDGVAAGYGGGTYTADSITTQLPDSVEQARSITIPGLQAGGEGRLGLMYGSMSFSAALNILDNFGSVRVLSNPSIRARNSRPAFISVGRNSRYIAESTAVTNSVGGGDSVTSTSVTTSSVFNGIMLGVQPFISDDGEISLSIHPMQSEVQEESLQLIEVGGDSRVSLPIIDFKGMTTSLSMNSGDTVILGGLIDEVGGSSGSGIPVLRELRGVGGLFGRQGHTSRVRELVIVLRVTII
ncbi:pilus (MSHA type) biogenesis protein MshL [Pseudohongiella sp. SYSU M77423]|uniref:pilus (MSHA type) biogenesis protein MshL n=1 Tax=Pseudohongiella sp. SYSU M77423 TaxID=3042312 RepID=UPI0024817A24|nr:pilus (MSHA type) biogenesis protein MshL [Pseudohongiella sp. SYSU M77423]MDH7942552.1 pilus (MSHA type) biogenesis protein MshL [Pseudohongiella sp. SYSU M77423]